MQDLSMSSRFEQIQCLVFKERTQLRCGLARFILQGGELRRNYPNYERNYLTTL